VCGNVGEKTGTDPLFEVSNLFIRQRVGLCDDRDEVDFRMESAHEFNVKLLQTETES